MEVCLCYNLQTNQNENIDWTVRFLKRKWTQKSQCFCTSIAVSVFSALSTIFHPNLALLFSEFSHFILVKNVKMLGHLEIFFYFFLFFKMWVKEKSVKELCYIGDVACTGHMVQVVSCVFMVLEACQTLCKPSLSSPSLLLTENM